MTTLRASRDINAPLDLVFKTVSEINNFRKAIPHIIDVEFVTEQQSGVGTRFKETREMNGRKATTELEVTELEPNRHVRIVSEAGGTLWDTVFSVQQEGDATRLEMVMEATPKSIAGKLSLPLIKGMIQRALEADMDAVRNYCEGQTP